MNPTVLAWALALPADSLWRKLALAYASGVTRVRHEGREVQYRSQSEMERVLTTAHAAENPRARRPSVTIAVPADIYR